MNPSANSSSMQQPSIQSPNQLQLTKTKSAKSDRHLKVDGRDRRIRLPASCAKRLFDLNKKLNHKTPGQTVEWLMNRSSSTIDDVKSKNTPNATAAEAPAPAPATAVMINPTDHQNAMVVKHANAAATTVVNVVNPHPQDQLMAYQHQYPMGTYRLSQLMQVPMAPAPPAVAAAAAANTMYFNTINVGFSGFQGGGFAGNHGISGGGFAAVRDNRVIMEQSSSSRGISSTTVQNETEISGDDDEDNIDQFLRDDDA